MRLFVATAIAAYVGATLLATQVAGRYAGDAARVAQTAIVLGATTALMTLLSTPWLRAWTKVKVAKHFFDHRYDYRAEWQRFTATLGSPGEGADPLDRRIVRAMAELTGSPAGLLLIPAGMALEAGAAWHWPEQPPEAAAGDTALFAYLAATGRIIALDQVRRGDAPEGEGLGARAPVARHQPDRGDPAGPPGGGPRARLGGPRSAPRRRTAGGELPCRGSRACGARRCRALR
ncbi:hypothetical protein WR25_04088 [Diploscapter pachys]|uniref:Uncharacterized protein n=1 Tax=Diploscapter pachys TaxID=2018661 RepID=A0A2A2M459_9BILA|nr:hypothetical protein WR25_04088 [Diploscapter pachys]